MTDKPRLKLDLVDFGGIDKYDNWFVSILSRDFRVEISDRPDLLIFQEGGHLNRLYTCKKLFWTGESILPDWSRTDFAMTCHYIDDPRHLRFPYYVWGCEARAADLIRSTDEPKQILSEDREFCAAVISNGNPRRAGERARFLQKLHARKAVASGGRFMNNVGDIGPGGRAKYKFIRRYKFNLCYENKSLPGYTTEKLTDAMWARCVPIYWGNSRVGEEFNRASFLYRPDFSSDEEFIEKIIEVNSSPKQYLQYLEAPFFPYNAPNTFYSEQRLRDFFRRVVDSDRPPVSRTRRGFTIGRWVFAKHQHF